MDALGMRGKKLPSSRQKDHSKWQGIQLARAEAEKLLHGYFLPVELFINHNQDQHEQKQKDHQNCQSRAKHDNRLPQALLQPVYIGRNTDKIGLVIAQIEAGQQGLVRVSLPRFLVSKFQIAIHPAGKNPICQTCQNDAFVIVTTLQDH